jgi:signal peptidase I
VGGDRIKIVKGEVYYRFRGTEAWMTEAQYKSEVDADYKTRRRVHESEYDGLQTQTRNDALQGFAQNDSYDYLYAYCDWGSAIYPHERRLTAQDRRFKMGWYVAPGRVFPMGDNRDNSRDARYFGPVAESKVLGQALFIYWPLLRLGGIR